MLDLLRTIFIGTLTAIGVTVMAFALHAQDQTGRQPFQTEVNYVRVDMYPTAAGRPVADLAAEDVEVLEDGAPQKIAQFERVSISGPRPQTTSPDPSTVADMRRAAQDPHARLFVLFVDPRHVDVAASMKIRKPLIDALNRLVGGEDLIAVMTPDMSAEALTFTRRTDSIERLLTNYWGEKEWAGSRDPVEFKYEACYPDPQAPGIAKEMIQRRREQLVLDALDGLVTHLSTVREERKAVITISEGWPLYGPNRQLARSLDTIHPTVRPVTIDPKTGRPTTAEQYPFAIDYTTCEVERYALSELQDENRFLTIMQTANRGNVSFYPVDPRGFSMVDPLGMFGLAKSLRTMADVTDGIAILGDLQSGLQRVVDDLSSYYLLGYYSPAKPDGKYHRITVRVKRPGVDVRARPGYLASKAPTVSTSAKPPAPALSDAEAAEGRLVASAIGTLAAFDRERPLRLQAASGWTASGEPGVWLVVEAARNAGGEDWSKGGTANVKLIDEAGADVAATDVPLLPGVGPISARVFLKTAALLTPGEYQIRVRATSAGVLPATEMTRITVAASPAVSGALFNRRSVSTGNREAPTADLRFRRAERVIVLLPASSADTTSARLLDRTGKALAIPVTAAMRNDADGSRWRAAELVLAPLAPGDYLIEITAGTARTLTAFRVLP